MRSPLEMSVCCGVACESVRPGGVERRGRGRGRCRAFRLRPRSRATQLLEAFHGVEVTQASGVDMKQREVSRGRQ